MAYINGMGCVTAQEMTNGYPEKWEIWPDRVFLPLQLPDYKAYFSPIASRRMAKGVKNGIVAATKALSQAQLSMPDAIITGTGLGCIEDSDKFLRAILDNNESFLTPTSFIQSTHNTVGAQIALHLGCKGYNFTYVNGSVSFESALMDAQMMFDERQAQNILVGGIDEMNDYTLELFQIAGKVKKGTSDARFYPANTPGAVYSEGAAFFALGSQKTDHSYARIDDIFMQNAIEQSHISKAALDFLSARGLAPTDVDALVLGYNGDVNFDGYYDAVSTAFPNLLLLCYKNLSGEFHTSSAVGLLLAAHWIKGAPIPEVCVLSGSPKPLNRILLYNQYRGKDHSFVLLSKP